MTAKSGRNCSGLLCKCERADIPHPGPQHTTQRLAEGIEANYYVFHRCTHHRVVYSSVPPPPVVIRI